MHKIWTQEDYQYEQYLREAKPPIRISNPFFQVYTKENHFWKFY